VWGNVDKISYPVWSPWVSICDEQMEIEQEYFYDGSWLTGARLVRDHSATSFVGAQLTYHPSGRVERSTLLADDEEFGRLDEGADPSGMGRPGSLSFSWRRNPAIPLLFDTKWSQGSFAYDGSGNVAGYSIWWNGASAGLSREYTYDGHNRLTEFLDTGSSARTYEYDRFGNLTTIGGANTFGVDPTSNRLTNVGGAPIAINDWDARGNLKRIPESPTTREKAFSFSAEDRLTESRDVVTEPEIVWRYAYDTSGERVVTWANDENGATTEARIAIRDETGAVLSDWLLRPGESFTRQRDYSYAAGGLIAQIDWGDESTTRSFVAADHLGSTRYLLGIDNDRFVTTEEAIEYYPFGEIRNGDPQHDPDTTHLFTGHERDLGVTMSELDYMHARYYSPNLGRFVSADPIGGKIGSSQSWNRYSYALNNPVIFVDPDGREVVVGQQPERVATAILNMIPADIRHTLTTSMNDYGQTVVNYDPNVKSDSLNYNNLVKAIDSQETVVVNVGDGFALVTDEGNTTSSSLTDLSSQQRGITLPAASLVDDGITSTSGVTEVYLDQALPDNRLGAGLAAELEGHVVPLFSGESATYSTYEEHKAKEAPAIEEALKNAEN